jgi:hypothetical protein
MRAVAISQSARLGIGAHRAYGFEHGPPRAQIFMPLPPWQAPLLWCLVPPFGSPE